MKKWCNLKKRLLNIFVILIISGCNGSDDKTDLNYQKENHNINMFVRSDSSITKAISFFEKQFGLNSLKNGYDSLQIRVWFDGVKAGHKYLQNMLMIKLNSEDINVYHYKYISPEEFWYNFNEQIKYSKVFVRKKNKRKWEEIYLALNENAYKDVKDFDAFRKLEHGFSSTHPDRIIIEISTMKDYIVYSQYSPQSFNCKLDDCIRFFNIIKALAYGFDIEELKEKLEPLY
ncbi:hypothetical protein [Polluticaenibacter yanchengensis]|uniref:Lipoprotein n=1 Tax=Polluticaenibacter yanchengensis TaxID=3014562 RepID=A0ABT4UN95_9BACT|nr:hypothetical protein [Chitinophagaceae bacterium LY-5]